jgi:hypothetical protein
MVKELLPAFVIGLGLGLAGNLAFAKELDYFEVDQIATLATWLLEQQASADSADKSERAEPAVKFCLEQAGDLNLFLGAVHAQQRVSSRCLGL